MSDQDEGADQSLDIATIGIGITYLVLSIVLLTSGLLLVDTPVYPSGFIMILVGLFLGYWSLKYLTESGAFDTHFWRSEVRMDGFRPRLVDTGDAAAPYHMREPSDTRHMFHRTDVRVREAPPIHKDELRTGARLLLFASVQPLWIAMVIFWGPAEVMMALWLFVLGTVGVVGSLMYAMARYPMVVVIIILMVIVTNLYILTLPIFIPLVHICALLGAVAPAIGLLEMYRFWKD